jgi:hypothetical protein
MSLCVGAVMARSSATRLSRPKSRNSFQFYVESAPRENFLLPGGQEALGA